MLEILTPKLSDPYLMLSNSFNLEAENLETLILEQVKQILGDMFKKALQKCQSL